MTDLKPRKMDFGFEDEDVPFLWNPDNPAWSSMSNAVSFLAIGFEKMIFKLILQAKPLITDPEVAAEAVAFMRQEGHHSTAHRQHVTAPTRRARQCGDADGDARARRGPGDVGA